MDQADVLPNLGGLGGPDHAGVNRLFREVLRERGFQWCDDNGQEQYAAEVLDPSLHGQPLLAKGWAASSTDHPAQSIGKQAAPTACWGRPATHLPSHHAQRPAPAPTMVDVFIARGAECTLAEDHGTFWSSTGSAEADADEWLLYRLGGAAAAVRFVQLRVFRALYQFG